jgi:V/A-type H+-transporting ATPase subunit B
MDKKYLKYADECEKKFISQGDENRSIEKTFSIAWDLFTMFPHEELKKIKMEYIQKYHPEHPKG